MKKHIKIIVTAMMAVLLSGCMKMRVGIDVSSDGTAKESLTILMQNSMLGTDTDFDTALEEMKKSYQEQYPDQEVEIIKEGDGEEDYSGVCISGMDAEGLSITKEKGKITVELPVNNLQSEMSDVFDYDTSQIDMSTLKEYGFEASVIVNMPSTPETNVGTVEGKQVTIDLLSLPGDVQSIVITCSSGLNLKPFLVGGIVIIAGLAAAFFMKNKKQNARV